MRQDGSSSDLRFSDRLMPPFAQKGGGGFTLFSRPQDDLILFSMNELFRITMQLKTRKKDQKIAFGDG